MIATIAGLGLAGLAAAAPTTTNPLYPETSSSTGFNLVLNVTDPSWDLDPPVHGTFVTSIHVGPALNYVGQTSASSGRLFYVNGTATDVRYGNSDTISDGGTPPFPEVLSLLPDQGSATLSTVFLNAGNAAGDGRDYRTGITGFPNPIPELYPVTYVACREPLAYYGGKEFVIIKQAKTTVSEGGQVERNIPDGCAPLSLLPQCAELNELPAGSLSSHDFAATTRCYTDVNSIDWPKYHAY
ncbi:hypothetical protein ISF_01638 [Cordyceps fumosorosea ARSEF 2679]|uniref:DUF7907 domain-containing protein n=1 Tax=Cordyceps fumosorosea (strain ARSEF 2679) TaxID=1081104 RepID=A0A168DFV4_CORFA|nr:hypothetical protein ISF_01638 [Cordyceps fumosorosea ARSEF 2679]OAA72565.1 hypothetical protein ISF_01638 [Cordyceps fumosorosea ARSEF 2679]